MIRFLTDESIRGFFGKKKKSKMEETLKRLDIIKPSDLIKNHVHSQENIMTDPRKIAETIALMQENETPTRQSHDLYNGINSIKYMVEKLRLWEELGVSRPSTMSGGDRPLALIEKKINEIIEELNKK